MKQTVLILLIFFVHSLFAQKEIQVPPNRTDTLHFLSSKENLDRYGLEDLTESTDKFFIRIRSGSTIFEIKQNENVVATSILSVGSKKKDYQYQKNIYSNEKSKVLLDSLLSKGVLTLLGDKRRGVDGSTIIFEVATPEKYRMFSYWSPCWGDDLESKRACEIWLFLGRFLDMKNTRNLFYEILEPGTTVYNNVRIDYFLPENTMTSSLYAKVKKRLKEDLQIDENSSHSKFPVTYIGKTRSLLSDLNNYELSQVDTIKILPPNNPYASSMYGSTGSQNGLVLIELKK